MPQEVDDPKTASVFIERSRLGKVFYQIDGGQLRISGKRSLARLDLTFELREISSDVRRLGRRFFEVSLRLYCLAITFALCAFSLFFQKVIPFEVAIMLVEMGLLFSVCLFIVAYRWTPRLEVARFKSVLGGTRFDVVKESDYAEEFENFVSYLRENVRQSKDPTYVIQQPGPVPPQIVAAPENCWKAALLFGTLSIVLPQSVRFEHLTGEGEIFIIFFCSAVGVSICVRSFLKKERFRYLSLIGAVLSVLPPIIYA